MVFLLWVDSSMIAPMLCQTGQPSDLHRAGWVSEIKFDGTRAFLIKTGSSFDIQNRRGVLYTHRLPEITQEAKNIEGTYTLDGELCYFNHHGISEFTPCQRRCSTQNRSKIMPLLRQYPLNFVAFDILECNGEDFRKTPYWARKEMLDNFFFVNPRLNAILYAEHSEEPQLHFESIMKLGGEGIILKRLDSYYYEGVRSHDWLKVRQFHTAICDVEGYTEGNNQRSDYFGSLVLSQNGKYVGNCGGGFSDQALAQLTHHLKRCPQTTPPFAIDEHYTAVKTDLQVQVRYFQRTENGVFRFPSYLKIA